jgi:hypothetical protein
LGSSLIPVPFSKVARRLSQNFGTLMGCDATCPARENGTWEPSSGYGGVHDVSHVFFVNVPCWLFEDHLKKYLLETISPIVGSSLKLGRLLTPVSCAFFSTMRGMIGRGRHDDKLFVMGFVKATCLTAST